MKRPRIAVVTDSTCDLPAEVAEREGIQVVPAFVNIGGQSLRDGIDISRESFYRQLPALPELPTTSSPSPGMFVTLYRSLVSAAEHIVSIHAASQLTAIVNSARLAASQVAPDRITIVDSGQLSMGLGWAVLAAVRAAQKGANLQGVIDSMRASLRRSRVYAVLNHLRYIARSGRVNPVQIGLSSLLNIKPMVELRDGVVASAGRARTWSRAVEMLAEKTISSFPLERLAVLHTNFPDGAADVLERVTRRVGRPAETMCVNVTTVIGVHVGPEALGVALVREA